MLLFLFISKPFYFAKAFFTDDHRNGNSYGVFKRQYNNDIYLNVSVGFIPKTFNINLSNISLYDDVFTNNLTQKIPGIASQSLSDKYTYSLTIGIGYHGRRSGLRHELQAEWYNLYTTPKEIGGDNVQYEQSDSDKTDVKTYKKTAKATKIGDSYYIDLGSFSTHINLTYNLYYNFQNVFKFWSTNWDIYFGVGIGWAIINGGVYSTKYISEEADTEQSDSSNDTISTTTRNVLYENTVEDFSSAAEHKVIRKTFFAVAYHADVGMLANISQSFAINLGLHFGATSRPLLTSNFHQISGTSTSSSHLEMHISIKFGMFIKAFTFN